MPGPRNELQTSFNGGELSARMEGRTDLSSYAVAGREVLNMQLTVQGPLVKRSGTLFTSFAKFTSQANRPELIPFEPQASQAYVIEAGPQYFRFFTNDVRIETAPDVAYELATPFEAQDLPNLDWEASVDVLYLVDGRHPPQKLSRTSATTFALAPLELRRGPFRDQNSDESLTVQASAGTGTVTLTASSALFVAGHVGSLIEIEARDFRSIPAWEPGIEVNVGEKRRSEGKVYQAIQTAISKRTGAERPIHVKGQEWDGMVTGKDINAKDAGGVLWEFLYSRYGIARITAVNSPTSATATVIDRLPDEVVSAATDLWALGAFSDAEGWPTNVTIRDQRLWLAKGPRLFASAAGDFENFRLRDEGGLAQPDLAISIRLSAQDPIQWLANDRDLLIGTASAEFAVLPVNPAAGLAFNNIRVPRQSFHGSRRVKPVSAGNRLLFVTRGGRKLREAGYDFNFDRYVAPDTTVRAEHVSQSGFRRLAAAMEPDSSVWALREDGTLACFTYAEEQEVRGWSRHRLGGPEAVIESIAAVTAPDGTRDQLWLVVRRRIAGDMRRTIERMAPTWETGTPQAEGHFLDCGLFSDLPAPATVIGGLQHLARETVQVVVDGAIHPDMEVSPGGTITLATPGRRVHVGYFYPSRFTSMQLDTESETGSSASKIKRVVKLGLRVIDTRGIRVRREGGRDENIIFRKPSDLMDQAPPLFTGELVAGFPGTYERDARVTVESWQALPFTLVSLSPRLVASLAE